jgi:hypothetical protein
MQNYAVTDAITFGIERALHPIGRGTSVNAATGLIGNLISSDRFNISISSLGRKR